MTDDRTTVLAIASDVHAGSTLAVCPPSVVLDDGGSYTASLAQRWLWQCWHDGWQEVGKIRDAEDANLVFVSNGDAFDGDHHNTPQILSRNPNAPKIVIEETLRCVLDLKPDRIFVVRGTESHVGKSASAEESLAHSLHGAGHKIVKDERTGTYSHWHVRKRFNGWFRASFAHHGRTGYRSWTKHNASALLAADIFHKYAKLAAERGGELEHPHVAIRSHFHTWGDSGSAHPVRVIQTPAWQLMTAYGHRKVTEELPELADIGLTVVVVRGREYDVRPILFRPKEDPWTE